MKAEFMPESLLRPEGREHWISTPHGDLYAMCWEPAGASAAVPIILFHDSLGCVALWRDFPAVLAAVTGRPVMAYDRAGFGRSMPHPGGWSANFIRDEIEQDFPRVQAAFGFTDFIAFGYSVGGDMAACCAAQHPRHCRGLITMAAPARMDAGMVAGLEAARRAFARPGQMERLARYHGDKAAWALSAWLDTWLSPAFAGWRIDRVASGVRCPVLVIHGEQDEYGSPEHARLMARLTDAVSEVVMIPECGHVPHREFPEKVLAAVGRFLARQDG